MFSCCGNVQQARGGGLPAASVHRFAVDVDGKASYQALRLAQALKQLDGCLEVISAAAQGQIVYFAGRYNWPGNKGQSRERPRVWNSILPSRPQIQTSCAPASK